MKTWHRGIWKNSVAKGRDIFPRKKSGGSMYRKSGGLSFGSGNGIVKYHGRSYRYVGSSGPSRVRVGFQGRQKTNIGAPYRRVVSQDDLMHARGYRKGFMQQGGE